MKKIAVCGPTAARTTRAAAAADPADGLMSAWLPIVEQLECRRFFAASTIQTLPFVLDFNGDRGELLDKDGQGTGFTRVQANKNGNEYQASLIDLDTAAGVLKLTTSGSSTTGSNTDSSNSLVNALETQFNATTSGFKISARLLGPLTYINTPAQQAGIFFGPDQDNYVKLVVVAQDGATHVQFMDEQKSGTGYTHALGFNTLIPISLAGVNTLDLQLVGDAASGKVQAYFSINGQGFQKFTPELTLSGTKKSEFFNAAGRAGVIALHKNNLAPITATYDQFKIEAGTAVDARPSVTAVRVGGMSVPSLNAVPRDSFIAADVSLPTAGAGVDTATLNSESVKLYRSSDHAPVAAVLNTSGGGDAIVLTPAEALDPGVTYTFEVTTLLKDTSGASFIPYTVSFTTNTAELETDPSLAFQKIALPTATGRTYTGVTFGPDGKLYASTIDGLIQRFSVNPDGTLGTPTNITSLQTKEGGATMLIGMAFAPGYNAAEPSSLTLWVTHNQYTDVNAPVADDFTGKVSRLTGANLQTVTTMVVNLPRSVRDHLTNQLTFGPDGAIYFNQGANTAMGAPDNAWGQREEHLLNAAILRLDTSKLPTNGTALNVKTIDVGGTYNPFNASNALTIYATGVRNSYDLVWTSTGRLFAPTNGSAAGGSTPGTPSGTYSFGPNQRIDYATNGAYTGPDVPGISSLQQTQNDYLFNVVKGGYYGNPNPSRGEFVLNGGNPTSSGDGVTEVNAYPVGTLPDRNYRGKNTGTTSKTMGSAYSFGKNYSPNGIIEYQGTAFNNALKGKLLIAEYSGGDDIVILTPDLNGNIISAKRGVAGLTHFTDPLDIIEDPRTGFLYVAEYGGQRLTLVRPIAPGANLETSKSQMVFNDITTSGSSAVQKIKITNTGTSALALPPDGLQIIGAEAARFAFVSKPAAPYAEIAPGDSLELQITFNAGATAGVIHAATLQIKSNDPDQATLLVPLRGLAMSSLAGGTNEPSLQRLMDLYRIPINVGDPDKTTTDFEFPLTTPNDEVLMPTLQKVGSGPVTIESLAVFGVGSSTVPTFRFGYYTPGNAKETTELLKVTGSGTSISNSQTVNPTVVGQTSFDPGAGAFGLYTWWQNFSGQPTIYSEDALNKLNANSGYSSQPHKVRFYKYKTPDGTVVPDAFIFTFEEFHGATDQQDYVGIIRNVKAAPLGSGAEIGFENLDGPTFHNHLLFNKVQDFTNSSVPNNIFHDKAVLRIRNTGKSALSISSIATSAGWTIEGLASPTPTIAAGASLDVNVRFTANPNTTSGQLLNGTLTINSNDLDEPTSTITLRGWWQPRNEDNKEPSLQQMFTIMGYKTVATYPGQTLGSGKVARVGDEVLSPYWLRSDATLPVGIRQLAAWHGQGNTESMRWFPKGSTTFTTLFVHDGEEGQSFLPHVNNGASGGTGAAYAAGSFNPAGAFGLRILNEYSDPTKNYQEQSGGGWGHHVRFFVARDQSGAIIPNAYLVTMDYSNTSGTNYDFNDNVYLITNVKPENAPGAPAGLSASVSGAGVALNWNDNTEANLAGYNVYRGTASGGPFTQLNAALLEASEFVDVTAPLGQQVWYVVRAVDNVGNVSGNNAAVSATRTSDTTPPAIPKSFTALGGTSGIQLNWNDNTDADFLGYNLYRSTSSDSGFTKLNTSGLLGSSTYFDSSAPINVVTYYRVTAVDKSGNESAPASANATRQGSDTTAPAKPTALTAVGSTNGITLDWADTNTESDFLGYNVYRMVNGVRQKLNTSGVLGVSQFVDANAPAGVVSSYEVTAIDTANNESAAATASATRPADTTKPAAPSGVVVSATTAGINLDWANNSESDVVGYNVYRAASSGGPWTKLNTSGLIASSLYNDTTAPSGQVSYYQITAVDASGNESDPASASGTRPAGDTLPPATPAGLTAVAVANGIQLDWADNIESDLAGYNVYRASSSTGTYTKINTSGVVANSAYLDATAPSGTSYYRVRAVDLSGNESSFAQASATRTTSYTHVEIGSPTPAGSIQIVTEGSAYNVSAGGADIWSTTDSFGFNYRQVTGDFDLKVRVAGLTNSNAWAKAGLMARESLVGNSRNVFALVSAANGHRLTHRASTGGLTSATGSGAATFPNDWIRLARVGNTFTGYRSTDGVTWTAIGSTTLALPQTLFFGLATTSHNTSALTTAQYRDLTSSQTPVNDPPAAPTGLTANATASGIQLDWANNSESDLAGYNVYRASSESGSYVKLNASGPVASSDYLDTTAPSGTSWYRIRAVDTAGNESDFAQTSATRTTTTSSYTHVEIGNPLPGSLETLSEGVSYNLRAAGADIWNTADSFGFNYRQVTGDFDVKVRMAGLTNTNAWAKAGLMARESLAANSRNVYALISASNGHRLTHRASTGGLTSATGSGAATFPNNWIRLARVGNTFTAYRSTDGATWTAIGSTTQALPQTLLFGIAATSHNTGALTTAQFRDLSVTGSQPVDEPPAAPTGLTASATTSGIALNWADNTEGDLAGYNVYRATSASGPWAKLNTAGLLSSSQYNDTSAPSGVESFYRIAAVDDAGHESAFALASATRPEAPALPAGPFKINFQVAGSPAVSGYIQDNGAAFGHRGNGVQYGWNVSHTDWARDRNKNADQLLDTLVHMKAASNWSIAIANGTYNVKVGVGDSQYATTNTVNVNGVNYWTNQALGINAFASKTMSVTVSNGKLTLSNGASADLTTRINYIEITPAPTVIAPTKINFQLAGAPAVAGYIQDNGSAFGARNGLNYGWNGDYSAEARDRNRNSNQLLDTLMHVRTGATWAIDLANGTYDVKLSIGDAQYASVHNLTANGVSVFSNVSLAANVFQQKTVTVNVTNGKLTLTTSGADRATRLNYIEVQAV